jgi:hypothetical protein
MRSRARSLVVENQQSTVETVLSAATISIEQAARLPLQQAGDYEIRCPNFVDASTDASA